MQAEMKKSGAKQEGGPLEWMWRRSREMARDIWLVLRVRSFQLIVLQVNAELLTMALTTLVSQKPEQ